MPARVPIAKVPRMCDVKDDAYTGPMEVAVPSSQRSKWLKLVELICMFFFVHFMQVWIFILILLGYLYHLGYEVSVVTCLVTYTAYLIFYKPHNGLGWKSDWMLLNPLWHLFQSYLGIRMIRKCSLDPSKQYLFAIQPHAILVLSRFFFTGGMFGSLFPDQGNFRFLAATVLFYIPFCRELSLLFGAIDAKRSVADVAIDKGCHLIVYPGGTKEIYHSYEKSKVDRVVIRKGFIKMAIQKNLVIVPTLNLGEKFLYHSLKIPDVFVDNIIRPLKIALHIFWGRFLTWLPLKLRDRGLHPRLEKAAYMSPSRVFGPADQYYEARKRTGGDSEARGRGFGLIFGEPIELVQDDNPSAKMIDKAFKTYQEAMSAMFDEYKTEFGYSSEATMEWVDN